MKLTKSVEQALSIMAILGTQIPNTPVASTIFQRRLHTSVTYTQKILRKLVVKGLIYSIPGNNGGYILAKSPEEITLLSVVEAIEGTIVTFPETELFAKAFDDSEHPEIVKIAEQQLTQIFHNADNEWCQIVSNNTLASLLTSIFQTHCVPAPINWNEK